MQKERFGIGRAFQKINIEIPGKKWQKGVVAIGGGVAIGVGVTYGMVSNNKGQEVLKAIAATVTPTNVITQESN